MLNTLTILQFCPLHLNKAGKKLHGGKLEGHIGLHQYIYIFATSYASIKYFKLIFFKTLQMPMQKEPR